MNKTKVFFGCVQTLLILVRLSEETRGYKLARRVTDILVRAGEIPEEAIPDDVSTAAEDFANYAAGVSAVAPEWYRDWLASWPEDVRPGW